MNHIEYVKLSQIDPASFLPILNKQTTRDHLIDHDLFDVAMVTEWIEEKSKVDLSHGCRVRGIMVDKHLAGWCGIQFEEGSYEIAIVIEDRFWGIGKMVYLELMTWAKELGHKTVLIHFLHTRPQYKFLRKMAKNVYEKELLGRKFMTYELEVK